MSEEVAFNQAEADLDSVDVEIDFPNLAGMVTCEIQIFAGNFEEEDAQIRPLTVGEEKGRLMRENGMPNEDPEIYRMVLYNSQTFLVMKDLETVEKYVESLADDCFIKLELKKNI